MGDALPRLYGPLNPEPEAGRGGFERLSAPLVQDCPPSSQGRAKCPFGLWLSCWTQQVIDAEYRFAPPRWGQHRRNTVRKVLWGVWAVFRRSTAG